MFTTEESWNMSEPEKVVALIKEAEVWRLGNFDGCICSSFSVRNVDVQISCGKGQGRAIKVSSVSGDYYSERSGEYGDPEMLRPIAEEVQRQILEKSDGRGPIPIILGGG